jgi:branched-chain amino acid transport system substrate-binding protein
MLAAAAAVAAGAGVAHAQYSDGAIKIGVMNDQSGLYADLTGQGSVWSAKKAIEDFCKATKCHDKIEVVFADHQNKPDVGSNIVRQWYDVDKVDVVVDVPTSSVALAVNNITKEKNKVFLVSGAATSDLTGKACTPNTIHWTYDTWALANGTANAIVKTGGKTWFFLTADYAFGHALERDTAAVVEKAGGKVLCAIPSRDRISLPSCCRPRPPRPRSSVSPTPAATRSTPSSRRQSSASSRADRTSQACWCSSPTCTRWACRPRRA